MYFYDILKDITSALIFLLDPQTSIPQWNSIKAFYIN